MKPPRFACTIVAAVLLALGAVFTLLGALGAFAVPIPTRSGEAWMFLPPGLILLAAGVVLVLSLGRTKRLQARLRAEGVPVPGRVTAIRHHKYTSYGTDPDFVGYKRSPWTVSCEYQWEGQTYTVRSALLWDKPRAGDQQPTVYLDPNHPKQSFLDPESLQYEMR